MCMCVWGGGGTQNCQKLAENTQNSSNLLKKGVTYMCERICDKKSEGDQGKKMGGDFLKFVPLHKSHLECNIIRGVCGGGGRDTTLSKIG